MFKHEIQKFIEDKALFTLKDKVLVALSGGADSVALLRILLSLGYACECMHCNFHLRGEESDRDEAFVRALCEACSVPLHIIHFDTEKYAKEHHQSIEMAARELRYNWFHRLREERHASVIAVAHHRDDSVETFLLNLMRGAGINGLKGIPVKNGHIVRPLLSVSREGILDYLQAINQGYVTDSTNLEDEYMRNKIRLNILPLMKEVNPSVMETIQETTFRLSEVASIYQKDRMEAIAHKVISVSPELYQISLTDILEDVAPISLLHEVLSPKGFNASQIRDIHRSLSSSQSGKRFYTTEWEVLRDREYLWIQKKGSSQLIPELIMEEVERTPSFVIPRDKHIACLDADQLNHPLTIRKWEKGDKFVPLGMNGKKKVSDYLTDKKFSLFQKENQYVVCCGENIVWLVNERSDHRYRITDRTQRILLIQIKKDGQ
jgi:tRNA(Ile)-lysidine synthase